MEKEETVLQEVAASLANAKAISQRVALAAVLQWNERERKEVKLKKSEFPSVYAQLTTVVDYTATGSCALLPPAHRKVKCPFCSWNSKKMRLNGITGSHCIIEWGCND